MCLKKREQSCSIKGDEKKMKKMLAAVTMCLLLVGIVASTAAVSATPTEGKTCICKPCMCKPSVVRFIVTDPSGVKCGKIRIHNDSLSYTQGAKFVCNCHGLQPCKAYNLVFTPTGGAGAIFIKNGIANGRGHVHMVGALAPNFLKNVLPSGGNFSLVLSAPQ
jgi:hypothetical protein